MNSRWLRISGFTLIEMLVVLAILALAATFAVPMLSSGSEGVRLDVATSELTNALRVTRSAAITSNRPTALTIDVNRRRFKSSVVAERTFDAGIDAKLTFAAGIGSRGSGRGVQVLSRWIIDGRGCDTGNARQPVVDDFIMAT